MSIIVKNALLVYPAIWDPLKHDDFDPRYATAFEYKGKELEHLGFERSAKTGLYSSNSKFAPEIHSKDSKSDYSKLVLAKQIAEARNLNLNRVFKDIRADLEVRVFEHNHPKALSNIGMSIVRVWVNEEEILTKARIDI